MIAKGHNLTILFISIVAVLFLAPDFGLPHVVGASATTLCPSIPNYPSDFPTKMYPAPGGGAFVETGSGNLVYCAGGTATTIATNPEPSAPWDGMGGVISPIYGIVLALTSYAPTPGSGVWLCFTATSFGCNSGTSQFITLPSSFCSTEPAGYCEPIGTALDSSLNLYYVDYANAKLVECMYSNTYQTCTNLPASSALKGYSPIGLALVGGTFYVADHSCSGRVWKGTKSSLSVIYKTGEALTDITASKNNPTKTLHVYGVFSGSCKGTGAYVKDLTDGKKLSGPYSGFTPVYLDSKLQVDSSYSSGVFQMKDTS